MSFLELELTQVTPKLTAKVKIEDFTILEQVKEKERNSFFNLGESKYIQIENTLFSVKTIKCLVMQTGDNQKE